MGKIDYGITLNTDAIKLKFFSLSRWDLLYDDLAASRCQGQLRNCDSANGLRPGLSAEQTSQPQPTRCRIGAYLSKVARRFLILDHARISRDPPFLELWVVLPWLPDLSPR